ncbi:MAG: 3'(2'),5'-bisphosphate nucleotidase CysQ [Pirellulaceae bacterium]
MTNFVVWHRLRASRVSMRIKLKDNPTNQPGPSMQHSLPDLLDAAEQIAFAAGQTALHYYGQPIPVEAKADHSPLTQADKAAHALIATELAQLTPDIPVVSEEGAESAAVSSAANAWRWLVDPLDGTKEFIKQTGQFTVNIALVHGNYPVLGVVHVPVSSASYLGLSCDEQRGAWLHSPNRPRQPIRTRTADRQRLTIVASRDHAGPVVEAFLARLQGADVTSMGSSLKFCLVAEGKADFYPRIVPTMQWDTAAAQAVVEAAGGHLTELDGTRLAYPKDRLRNPSTMTFGDNRIDWGRVLCNDE